MVSVPDLDGIERIVEVTAATLYEALVAALAAFREGGRSGMDSRRSVFPFSSLRLITMCESKTSRD